MARYESRERIIYDIFDTEIHEAVSAYSTAAEADEAVARLNRSPVDSAPHPVTDEVAVTFERRPDDAPVVVEVGTTSIT